MRRGQAYEAQFEQLENRGFARRDVQPADAPFDADALALNFARSVHAHQRTKEPTDPAPLVRWDGPVLYDFVGGSPTQDEQAHMEALAVRLSDATGLEVRRIRGGETLNLAIFVLDGPQRAELVRQAGRSGGFFNVVELITSLGEREGRLCIARMFRDPEGDPHVITGGATVIRAELPTDWRRSCLDEEVAQILGPRFDHLDARPSIFNDDEEFLHLTDHDEAILRLLYDPRLSPGMMREDSAPLLPGIIRERGLARPGES